MNPFEQPIPKKPTEAGSDYFDNKKEETLKKYEQEKFSEALTQEKAFASFDEPLRPESKEQETSIEQKMRLLSGVISNINRLEEEISDFSEELAPRTGQAHQIEELEVLKEKLFSQISPKEFESFMDNQK